MKFLGFAAIAGLVLLAMPHAVRAQAYPPGPPYYGRDFSKIDVKVTDLGHNTYQLEGAGGNTTVAVGSDGIILVDSQFAPMHDKLLAAIQKISNLPLKYLVNTHYHPDHTDGNALFNRDGAVIVAQESVKTRMVNRTPLANNTIPGPWPAEGIPSQVFGERTTISVGGRAPAQLVHVPNAHTDGDTYVYFPDADVLAVGDIGVTKTGYPAGGDHNNGGNLNGIIAAYETFLKVSDDQTKIVSGHTPVAGKADLQQLHDVAVTARDRVAKMKAAGMTEDQVAAAKPLADIQAQRQANDMASERFVRALYQDLN